MNRSTALLSVLLLASSTGFAKSKKKLLAKNDKVNAQTQDNVAKKPDRKPEDEKPDRTAGVGAVVGYIYTGVGYGAEVWAAPGKSDRFHLAGQFLTTKGERTADSGDSGAQLLETIDYSIMEFALRGRAFVYNSFNISGGLSYDKISGNYGVATKDGAKLTSPFTATATLGHIGIGNHWSLDNGLFIGAEWVGFTFFLANSVEFEKNEDGTYKTNSASLADTSSDKKPEDLANDALRKSIEFKAVTVTAGIQF